MSKEFWECSECGTKESKSWTRTVNSKICLCVACYEEEKSKYKPFKGDITKVYIGREYEPVQRVVVCAANKYNLEVHGEIIICGARHHDGIMNKLLDVLDYNDIEMESRGEQGFIDQYGIFINRKDAALIAVSSGQKLRDPDMKDICFSENLY